MRTDAMRKRRNEAYRSGVVQRRIWLTVFSTCLILSIAAFTFAIHSSAKQEHSVYKYYTSVQVQPGDSLWSIASEYNSISETATIDYITEIKEINHIVDDEIHAGEYLTIPYYSADIK